MLARRGLTIIYGGGKTGLMGALADAALEAGGRVTGVITESMNTPALAHAGITRLEVTATIHQRKARMYALADGYIALPGGYGTLDELFETLTWAQIGEHSKPVGLLNVNGYYDRLLEMLDRATAEGYPETLVQARLGSGCCPGVRPYGHVHADEASKPRTERPKNHR